MGPPRLTVVEGTGASLSGDEVRPSNAVPANDPSPVPVPGREGVPAAGSGSPVHDLISSIESGSGGAAAGDSAERREKLRVLEAVIFAASEPLDEARLATYLPAGEDPAALLAELQAAYAGR